MRETRLKDKIMRDWEFFVCFAPLVLALCWIAVGCFNAAFKLFENMTITQGFWLLGAALVWVLVFSIIRTIGRD